MACRRRAIVLLSVTVFLFDTGETRANESDFTCNYLDDTCPFSFDGECDDGIFDGCQGGDCYDCDLCRSLSYDCQACTAAEGCYWCPGDGTCQNSNLYHEVFNSIISSCESVDDYRTSTCEESGQFFRYVCVMYPLARCDIYSFMYFVIFV